MSEYCFLDWYNGQWQPKRALPSWLAPEAVKCIPKPKFVLGEVVSFDWSFGPLCGDIRHIEACVHYPLEVYGMLPLDQVQSCTTIYLTAYANGHARWLDENKAWRGPLRKVRD